MDIIFFIFIIVIIIAFYLFIHFAATYLFLLFFGWLADTTIGACIILAGLAIIWLWIPATLVLSIIFRGWETTFLMN